MKLADLIADLPVRFLAGAGNVEVSSIVEDSRQAARGCLFIARTGLAHDGRRFVNDAVAAGAVAVLSGTELNSGVTTLLAGDALPYVAAVIAERFQGSPSRQLKLIGVTGTNGKTTTSHLVHQLLNRASQRCGLIGTVQIDNGASVAEANLTTPPALMLSPLLRSMMENGCKACVMETSSHALQQQRTAGLSFDVGVFTNISGDHLDYHATMENYIAAKARLFAALPREGHAVVNIDDPASQTMIAMTDAQLLTCSLNQNSATFFAEVHEETIMYVDLTIHGPWGQSDLRLPLCGRHNVMNALQAAAVGQAMGLRHEDIISALAACAAPPGRLEPVTQPGDPLAVYVDYAHTDDALINVLGALRPLVPVGGRLRVVFGCGGDRDRTKRPRMARAACELADEIIITSDNPRTEDPQAIVDEVHAGVPVERVAHTTCIVDRREAIHAAIERSRDNDVVLIAGKGHETYQIIGTQRTDFDDRIVAAQALATCRRRLVNQ